MTPDSSSNRATSTGGSRWVASLLYWSMVATTPSSRVEASTTNPSVSWGTQFPKGWTSRRIHGSCHSRVGRQHATGWIPGIREPFSQRRRRAKIHFREQQQQQQHAPEPRLYGSSLSMFQDGANRTSSLPPPMVSSSPSTPPSSQSWPPICSTPVAPISNNNPQTNQGIHATNNNNTYTLDDGAMTMNTNYETQTSPPVQASTNLSSSSLFTVSTPDLLPVPETQHAYLDEDLLEDDVYCSVVDDLGALAYECMERNDQDDKDNNPSNGTVASWPSVSQSSETASHQFHTNDTWTMSTSVSSQTASSSRPRWIRLENQIDATVQSIQSSSQVWDKIRQVRQWQYDQLMEKEGIHQTKPASINTNLYPRYWKPRTIPSSLSESPPPAAQTNTANIQTIPTSSNSPTGPTANTNTTFSVLQFNTLAEGLSAGPDAKVPFPSSTWTINNNGTSMTTTTNASSSYFYGGFSSLPYPQVTLDFDVRRWRLLEVLLGGGLLNHSSADYRPAYDILALEEVDRYGGFLGPLLVQQFGYQGVFCPKVQSPGVRLGWYSDGCALLWHTGTFELMGRPQRIPYQGRGTTQVCLLVTLQHLVTRQPILVAVTHLKAARPHPSCRNNDKKNEPNPSHSTSRTSSAHEPIRLTQVQQLIQEIERVQTDYYYSSQQQQQPPREGGEPLQGGKVPWLLPVVLAGDFNADPPVFRTNDNTMNGDGNDDESAIGYLLRHGRRNHDTDVNHSSGTFDSAYTEIFSDQQHQKNDDRFYTTWKMRGSSTTQRAIDYIFYHSGSPSNNTPSVKKEEVSSSSPASPSMSSSPPVGNHHQLVCQATLSIPKGSELEATKLPGLRYPSDHLAIGAQFELVSRPTSQPSVSSQGTDSIPSND